MYKDREKRKQASRESMRRKRMLTPENVNPVLTPAVNTLPPETLASIETTRLTRNRLKLEDDTKERLSRALCYQSWNRERLQNLRNQPDRVPSVI